MPTRPQQKTIRRVGLEPQIQVDLVANHLAHRFGVVIVEIAVGARETRPAATSVVLGASLAASRCPNVVAILHDALHIVEQLLGGQQVLRRIDKQLGRRVAITVAR